MRAIRKLTGPTRGSVLIGLPRDTRPGLYRVRAVLIGDGLRDRAAVVVPHHPEAARPLALARARGWARSKSSRRWAAVTWV